MATWSVKPVWKKSIIEYNHMTKDDNEIVVETGWRWGEFYVYTDDDNPPELEAGVDIMNCGYESELIATEDGCWEEIHYDDCDDETREWVEEFLEEGNSYFDLEEHEWIFSDCEFIISCEMEITKINDDGTEGQKITTGGEDTPEPVKFTPNAAWPFGSKDEE
jgi:hypothetical protein